MTLQIILLFLIILSMGILMAMEKMPVDTLAVTVMVVLIIGGFVTPVEGIAGMSNPAVVTILGLMILTVGLETTGVIAAIGKKLKKLLVGEEWKTLLILLFIVGCFSALLSTTAIVIVFMGILLKLSKTMPMNLSRFLMPLSFAGILGGSCTLFGTSTNLIVSSIADNHGLPEFKIFEFTHIGVIFFIVGLAYIILVGRFMIPDRRMKAQDLTNKYAIQEYLAEVVVDKRSNFIGMQIDKTPFIKDEDLDLIEIKKPGGESRFPNYKDILQEGDVLLIKGSIEKLTEIRRRNNFTILYRKNKIDENRMNTDEMTICEVIVKPNSRLVGKTLKKVDIKRDYDAIPLAVKKNRRYYRAKLEALTIESGDILLMEVGRSNFKRFQNLAEFYVLQEHEGLASKSGKRNLAAVIMGMVILLAAFNVLTILVSTLLGCVAMFLTGCLDLQKAYRRVEWNVFFLLAGVIPLGTAMENTGASLWIANNFVNLFENLSPYMLVAVLYLATTLFSALISNNATAILFAPIVISIATNLDIDPRPLLLTVMFASNMSFMSPIGYQTNTLVYGVGQYRFIDFFKVGGLLSIIIWLLASFLIPFFYF